MRIIVFGGDGFCGWPTSLRLAAEGNEILIVDNLSRRKIDEDLKTNSLTDIHSIQTRLKAAKDKIGDIDYINLDIAKDVQALRDLIKNFQPDSVIQFAEQRAAPYSMINDASRRYTIDNNVSGTHNICSALVDLSSHTHFVHLGTMGVYGYNKDFGKIPEGYLNVQVNETKKDVDILYPANPGSIYHLTKCLDQLIFQYYNKNWNLKITDLHQGIVWGINTPETAIDERLTNRFDYDGLYGTVLNRFISQAAAKIPLTVYGTGGQDRAFIHISDTAKCLSLAVNNPPSTERVEVFNQVSEVRNVLDLANILKDKYGAEVSLVENPRNELADNELEVSNEGLKSLGFDPITLNDELIEDVKIIAEQLEKNFRPEIVLNSPKWN